MSVIAPAGLVPLNAPLPSPRQFDLLSAADLQERTANENRWLGGASIGGYVSGPASTFDPCSTGTNRQKNPAGTIPLGMAGTFVAYLIAECTAQSIGPDPTYQTDRLRLAFRAYEGAAVERVMVSGDHHGTLGSYLGDGNMKVLGGGAVSSTIALALLEDEIARHGNGVIHATPSVATLWASVYLIASKGNRMYTQIGTPVAVGAGYIDAVPDGQAAATSTQAWAFASGPVQISRQADMLIYPETYAQALDRSNNDVLHIAERAYLINWIGRQDSSDEDQTQAGVLVDFTA